MNKTKLAKNLLEQKENGLSIKNSIQKSWKRLLIRLFVIGVSIFLYFSSVSNDGFLLVVGMLLGATLQDLGWLWRIGKNWAFTEEVINWEKVKEIANNS